MVACSLRKESHFRLLWPKVFLGGWNKSRKKTGCPYRLGRVRGEAIFLRIFPWYAWPRTWTWENKPRPKFYRKYFTLRTDFPSIFLEKIGKIKGPPFLFPIFLGKSKRALIACRFPYKNYPILILFYGYFNTIIPIFSLIYFSWVLFFYYFIQKEK